MAVLSKPTTAGSADEGAFVYFRRLPIEIRNQIWEDALESRLVFLGVRDPFGVGAALPPAPPGIAHACQESRTVALRHGCVRSFCAKGWRDPPAVNTWFSPERDILLATPRLPSLEIEAVAQHLLLRMEDFQAVLLPGYDRQSCPPFPAVKQISLHVGDPSRGTLSMRAAGTIKDPKVVSELFGSNTFYLLYLDDLQSVRRTSQLLAGSADQEAQNLMVEIQFVLAMLRGETGLMSCLHTPKLGFGVTWRRKKEDLITRYLWSQFARQPITLFLRNILQGDRTTGISFNQKHEWVVQELAKMPAIRPVYIITRPDEKGGQAYRSEILNKRPMRAVRRDLTYSI